MTNTKWNLDPSHSEVQFKVRHMMIANVTGNFKKFEATVQTEGDDFTTANIHFAADIDSVSTNSEQRDGHLKSPDFFDAANHPQITFDSNHLQKTGDNEYKLQGTLAMHGISKPVTLNVEFGGMVKDPWGNTRVGFTVEGKISRKDFGLTWNAATETGGVVVSDDVRLYINAQFVKHVEQTATQAA
jgi:polyisoprenoid-binding protein YceI